MTNSLTLYFVKHTRTWICNIDRFRRTFGVFLFWNITIPRVDIQHTINSMEFNVVRFFRHCVRSYSKVHCLFRLWVDVIGPSAIKPHRALLTRTMGPNYWNLQMTLLLKLASKHQPPSYSYQTKMFKDDREVGSPRWFRYHHGNPLLVTVTHYAV